MLPHFPLARRRGGGIGLLLVWVWNGCQEGNIWAILVAIGLVALVGFGIYSMFVGDDDDDDSGEVEKEEVSGGWSNVR